MTAGAELRKRSRLARRAEGDRIVVDTIGLDSLAMALAETVLTEIGLDEAGRQTFARWAEQWWQWADGHHHALEDEELRARVWAVLRRVDLEFFDKKAEKKRIRPLDPQKMIVSSVIDAMIAVADRVASGANVPCALPGYTGPDPARVAIVRNGVVEPSTGVIHPATPRLFATAGAAVDFDPTATCPTWERFLAGIFTDEDGTDHETVRLVRQVFGWLIANDTTRHTIPIIIGPPRSGKSTMSSILRALLGEGNVCSPSPASLADSRFGLQPMLGKSAAIIPDARLSNRADQAVLAGILLTVSGRDPVEVDRKNRSSVSVRLGCRIVIVSNVLPAINDASGALASRFIVIETRRSFFGSEDRTLEERLRAELPGILMWALDGWRDLEANGWIKPARSAEIVEELDRLGSPIKAFMADKLEVRVGAETAVEAVYKLWAGWCEDNGRKEPGTIASFGKEFRSALPPGVKAHRPTRDGRKLGTHYTGIGERAPW